MVDIRAKPRTYMRMRQKKGGDVIAGIYRNRSSRETRVYPLGAPLSSFSWLMAHVSLPLTNRDVAFHQRMSGTRLVRSARAREHARLIDEFSLLVFLCLLAS